MSYATMPNRGAHRPSAEFCADCSASSPKWASLNRGVLVCDECSVIHRSLGRQVSLMKCLKRGFWPPSLMAMFYQLVNSHANSIWEHALLDPANTKLAKKKPSPQDPLYPVKNEFITAKYLYQAYALKTSDVGEGRQDLSQQLHSSVRTTNLETSLRLLAQGADPNYLHPERGTCPLHVAAQAGQSAQVELLSVYGADPTQLELSGRSVLEYAEQHPALALRITELCYEVTDTLSYHLCSRRPDHGAGQHFIIPEIFSLQSEERLDAQQRLLSLRDSQLTALTRDLHDEVDRRELDNYSQSSTLLESQRVPFLPVNKDLSTIRNQSRQKLGRLSTEQLSSVIVDLLLETRRRLGVTSPPPTALSPAPAPATAQPDTAASIATRLRSASVDEPPSHHSGNSPLPSPLAMTPLTLAPPAEMFNSNSLEQLHISLRRAECRLDEMDAKNDNLGEDMRLLQNMVKTLVTEISELRIVVTTRSADDSRSTPPRGSDSDYENSARVSASGPRVAPKPRIESRGVSALQTEQQTVAEEVTQITRAVQEMFHISRQQPDSTTMASAQGTAARIEASVSRLAHLFSRRILPPNLSHAVLELSAVSGKLRNCVSQSPLDVEILIDNCYKVAKSSKFIVEAFQVPRN